MKVAIVGAAHGHVGYALEEISAREELELVGIVEPNAQFQERFLPACRDIPRFESSAALYAEQEVDVTVVCGVYSRRAEDTVDALNAGAHVLADKPLLLRSSDLVEVEEAAQRTGRHVSMMFEKRTYPTTLAFLEILDSGMLGELALVASTGPHKLLQEQRPAWFLDRNTYGGIAADLPIHDIDLVLALTGATTGTVSALVGNARSLDHPTFDDHVALLMHAGTIAATIDAHWLHPTASEVHGHYRMRAVGTEGTAEIDWAYSRLTVTTHQRATWEAPLPPGLRPAERYFDALLAGVTPEVGTRESILASKVALAAEESARQGGVQIRW